MRVPADAGDTFCRRHCSDWQQKSEITSNQNGRRNDTMVNIFQINTSLQSHDLPCVQQIHISLDCTLPHLNQRNSVQCNDWNIIHRIGGRESLAQSKPVTCYITVMLQRESPWFLSDWNCRVISAYTQWMNGYIFTYSECDSENIPWISQYIHLQF